MKSKCGYLSRAFMNRDIATLRQLWSSYVSPIAEYACIVYRDNSPSTISSFEGILRGWTRRGTGQKNLPYKDRLRNFNLTSLQRRNERYVIISVFKMLENIQPNPGLVLKPNSTKTRILATPKLSKYSTHNNLLSKSFFKRAPELWNLIPNYLREITNVSHDTFKMQLDSWLSTVPDEPECSRWSPAPTSATTGRQSNSLLDWIPYLIRNPFYVCQL